MLENIYSLALIRQNDKAWARAIARIMIFLERQINMGKDFNYKLRQVMGKMNDDRLLLRRNSYYLYPGEKEAAAIRILANADLVALRYPWLAFSAVEDIAFFPPTPQLNAKAHIKAKEILNYIERLQTTKSEYIGPARRQALLLLKPQHG